MAEEHERQVSKFSSGVNQLLRLDNLWKDANSHSRSGRYSLWNNDLDTVWRELARDLGDNDYTKKKQSFDKFDSELGDAGKFLDFGSDTFDDVSPEQIKSRSKHYKILNQKELFLRRLENFLGKGTTWDEDDDDGFD